MAPKDETGLVLQGIPVMLYLDNGPGRGALEPVRDAANVDVLIDRR